MSNTNIEIQIREKCKECDGCGVIENPQWTAFYADDEKHKKETVNFLTNEECEMWFQKKYGAYTLPPQELQCYECEGSGEITRFIDLKELKTLLEKI